MADLERIAQLDRFYPPCYGTPAAYDYEKTQREIETELREEVDAHVRAWSRAFGYLPAALNRKIVGHFGKKREAMTVKELEAVRKWLAGNYQIPEKREPGMVLTPVNRAW